MKSTNTQERVLDLTTINPNVIRAEYAVRGATAKRAAEIHEEIKKGTSKYPFNEVLFSNIGNPMKVGLEPVTFYRQVMSVVMNKSLLDSPSIPDGVKTRAKFYLNMIDGGIGAYSESNGFKFVRERVAKFIENRDQTGAEVDPNNIWLSDGASQAIALLFTTIIRDPNDGIMIPIPQYPLYSAQLAINGCKEIPYYLDETNAWQVDFQDLQNSYEAACKKDIKTKAIVVINPGNPTGQILREDVIRKIIEFAVDNKLIILADEVYQQNIYKENAKFVSFRSVMHSMNAPYKNAELFSFHSASKGLAGECGLRGGYMQWENINPEISFQLHKHKSVYLSSNTVGQLMIDLITNPPTVEENGEEVTELFHKEMSERLESLRRRAKMVYKYLNELEGVSSNEIEGAMYCFPKITIPEKAIEKAQAQGIAPDLLYAMELLENTGLCGVQGSGFRQKEGTFHIRLTILILPEEKFETTLQKMKKFHTEFLERYS